MASTRSVPNPSAPNDQRADRIAREHSAILSQLSEAVILADTDGTLTFVNEAAEQLHGVRLLGVAPDDYSQSYHLFTEDGKPYPSRDLPLARAVRGETVTDACWRIRRPDGTEVVAVGSAKPLLGPDGEQVGAVLTAKDETERYRAEREVRENEARLRSLTENLPGGAVYQIRTDADGSNRRFVFLSRSYEQLSGVSAAKVLANPTIAYGAIDAADLDRFKRAEASAIESETSFDVQTRFRRADGEMRWCRFISAPRKELDGSIIWDGLQIDVTDLIRAETALKELNVNLEQRVLERSAELRLFQNIVQSDRSPVCAFDMDFRIIAFNQAHNDEFRRVHGFESKIGDVFPDLFPGDQQPVKRALIARALSGERFTLVEPFGRPEVGCPAWEVTYTPLSDGSGNIIGAFHHAKDISSRLLAEVELAEAHEALRQSQKLESMGQLTGGVAHDFNNLLTPIIGSLDMLVRREVGDGRERRMIDGALQSAERARVLVQRLLAFARRQPLQPSAINVGAVVEGMAELLSSTLGPKIDVQLELRPGLPPALGDANQLEMAILNLAVNARDAMPRGGTLVIKAMRKKRTEIAAGSPPTGDYICLAVTDTGDGMEAAILARAIEPFFSTKGIGQGTGLGLSMVHGLASQLGGGMTIASEPGKGTEVLLWLPVTNLPVRMSASLADHSALKTARGLVLLVDDEDLVRMTTAGMLQDLGYQVIEAQSAEDALTTLAGNIAPDLLITDHLMPGMSGVDLAFSVRSLHPDLPILIISGYAEADGITPDLPRLAKPFRAAELAASLHALTPMRAR